ncbi:hypothetical protein [Kaarinaea lacus]
MKINILKIALVAIMLAFLYGCDSSEDESCAETGINCPVGGTVTACCTSSSCRYVHNGNSYPCDGTDCSATAQRVADICLGNAAATAPGSTTVEKLLLLEKSENLLLEKEIDRLSSEK